MREAIFANFFGLSTQFDLYLIGTVFPLTINTVVLYLGQNYFIPNYNRLKTESKEKAEDFAGSTLWLFVLGGIVLFLILYFLSRPIINLYLANSAPAEIETAVKVFRIFIFTIPLNAGIAVLTAYSQSEFEFKYPALAQLFLNIAVIFLVLFSSAKWGIFSIPAGYVAGNLLQLVFLIIKIPAGVNFNPFTFIKSKRFLLFINSSLLFTFLIEAVSQVYLLADRYLFGYVDKGGIAALNYATVIYLLPISILSMSLSTVLFPKLSLTFNTQTQEELERHVNTFFKMNLFLFVPVSLLIIFFGDVFIKILYQRGAFSASDTQMTFSVLKIYALSLVFYSSYAVLNKLIYSAKMVKYLLIITLAGAVVKVLLNFVFVNTLKQDGLALGTTLSYLFFFLAAFVLIISKVGMKNRMLFFKELFFLLINGALSYCAAIIIVPIFSNTHALVSGIFQIIIFLIVYSLNSIYTGNEAVKRILGIAADMKKIRLNNL